jgi:hypothetical protein
MQAEGDAKDREQVSGAEKSQGGQIPFQCRTGIVVLNSTSWPSMRLQRPVMSKNPGPATSSDMEDAITGKSRNFEALQSLVLVSVNPHDVV